MGEYANQKAAIFEQWKKDMKAISQCPNVIAKLGGLAMPDNGFGWHSADKPPTSDQFIEAQKDFYLTTIEYLGVERCMFESNFPVDRFSLSYGVFWNAMKKMVQTFSEAEKAALFYDTAARVYKIQAQAL